MAATALVAGNSLAANALNYPPTISGESKHQTSPSWETGAQASLTRPDPTLVIPGTDWWWARSFEFHGVYATDPSLGAVGAGQAKYIPLGQTSPVYSEIKYDWDYSGGHQTYLIGGTSPTTATTYEVYYGGLGCWERYTSTQDWDGDICITNFVQGHPTYEATTNSAASDSSKNSIVGTFDYVKYKDSNGWHDLSLSNNGGKYCRTYGSDGTYGQDESITPSEDLINTGDSASTNTCSGIVDGYAYSLPG